MEPAQQPQEGMMTMTRAIITLLLLAFILPTATARTYDLQVAEDMVSDKFGRFDYLPDRLIGNYDEPFTKVTYTLVNPPFNSTNVLNVELIHRIQFDYEDGTSIQIIDSLVNHTVSWTFDFKNKGTVWTGSFCRPTAYVTAELDGTVVHESEDSLGGCFGKFTNTLFVKYSAIIQGNETDNAGFTIMAGHDITIQDLQGQLDLVTRINPTPTNDFTVGRYYRNFVSPAASSTIFSNVPFDAALIDYRFVTQSGVSSFFADSCNDPNAHFMHKFGCFLKRLLRDIVQTILDGIGGLLQRILASIGIDENVQANIASTMRLLLFFMKFALKVLFFYPFIVWSLGLLLWMAVGATQVGDKGPFQPFLNGYNYIRGTIDLFFSLIGWFASKFRNKPTSGGRLNE